MDQIYQLQRQIQDLRQEVNNISQVASQLQRSEANNAAQLQRLQQNESIATQQLNAIQQICNRLSQDVNAISNVAQQITSQIANRPMSTGQFGTNIYSQYGTGQFGAYGTGINTGVYGPPQFGTFGAQFTPNRYDEFSRNQYISSMAANRYGAGFNAPDYVTNQYISNLANQGQLGAQTSFGAGNYGTSTFGTGMTQSGYAGVSTGNFAVEPAHPVQAGQYRATGFTGSQYIPAYSSSQMSASSQPVSGLFGQASPVMGNQNIGRYSNF